VKLKKRTFQKAVFAICMILVGMACAYTPQYNQNRTEYLMTLAAAQNTAEKQQESEGTTSQLYARAAVLMDADSGRILLGKQENEWLPMASTTKIMTCILVLEEGNPDDMIPVSSYAAGQPRVHLGVKKGEYYRAQDLLYSLMLESHNDSAVVLAEYYGSKWAGLSADIASHSGEESQKAVTAFAAKMNEKAKKIGCEDTFFVTPNGLDGVLHFRENGQEKQKEHVTTASDLAAIMKYCAWESPASEKFLEITQTRSYTLYNYRKKEAEEGFLQADRVFSCQNHNAFLDMMDGVVSGKTGFTAKAGYCYVGALEKDGKRFAIALLACGWPNNKTWKWHDSRILLEYGLKHYEKQDLFCKTDLKELPVNQGQTAYVMTKVNEKKIERLVADHDRVEVILEMPERLQAPVSAGEKVGEQRYYINGELIETLSVVSVQKSLKIDYVFWVKKIVNLILL